MKHYIVFDKHRTSNIDFITNYKKFFKENGIKHILRSETFNNIMKDIYVIFDNHDINLIKLRFPNIITTKLNPLDQFFLYISTKPEYIQT